MHGCVESGELPPTGGTSGRRQGTRGDLYAEEIEVGSDLRGDSIVMEFLPHHIIFFFNIQVVNTDAESYDGRHPKKSVSAQVAPNGKYIEASLEIIQYFALLVLSLYIVLWIEL